MKPLYEYCQNLIMSKTSKCCGEPRTICGCYERCDYERCSKCGETFELAEDKEKLYCCSFGFYPSVVHTSRCPNFKSSTLAPLVDSKEEEYEKKHCPNCKLDFLGLGIDSKCPECETEFQVDTKASDWQERYDKKVRQFEKEILLAIESLLKENK